MKTTTPQKLILAFAGAIYCLFLATSMAYPGEFRVTPIRLEFDRRTKSGVITIVNEGDEKLNVQMKAFEWSQGVDGKDQYTETNDIIFFPRLMSLDKKEEKILRAGIRIPATAKEKTYRLFIEEIPEPKKAEGGVNVAIAIRFGVPIFVKPMKEETKGAIEKLEMSKGDVHLLLKNRGNTHFIVKSIHVKGRNAKGEEVFSKELSGWYLLSGASRPYTTPVPQEVCRDLSGLVIEIKTDGFNLNGKLDVDQTMCLP